MSGGRLADKVAVITGAGRGIGFAIATLFAREGARCALVIRNPDAGKDAVKRLADAPHPPLVINADVTDAAGVARAAGHVRDQLGAVDVLVNNAGVLLDEDRATSASAMRPETLETTLAVNLYGAVLMCAHLIPFMHRGSRIINVSSTMGQLSGGSAGYAPAYCISKTALNAYTQALAADLEPRGILCDCFHPGWAKTRMGGPNANVDPAESAQVALFLATRPDGGETGRFWRHNGIIDW